MTYLKKSIIYVPTPPPLTPPLNISFLFPFLNLTLEIFNAPKDRGVAVSAYCIEIQNFIEILLQKISTMNGRQKLNYKSNLYKLSIEGGRGELRGGIYFILLSKFVCLRQCFRVYRYCLAICWG